MKHLIIANLKSYKLEKELEEWLSDVSNYVSKSGAKTIVAPPFVYLHLLSKYPSITNAAQDVSPFPPGSYTGEINAEQLKDYQIKYCIVGHSERRKYFSESPTQINNKIDMLRQEGIMPIICLEKDTLKDQVTMINRDYRSKCIYVYEPSESIGTGNPADPTEIGEVASLIHSLTSPETRVLYGGSVDSGNIKEYLSIPGITGSLIATASLDPKSFIKILKNAQL